MISPQVARLARTQGHTVPAPTVKHTKIDWDLIDTPRLKASTNVPAKVQEYLAGHWNLHADTKHLKADNDAALKATSEERLDEILATGEDIEKANEKCLHRLLVTRQRLVPLVGELAKMYPKSSISMSGFFLYPEDGGYMGWHTNSDAPYTRLYITHVPEIDKSFFRYRNDDKCVTSWDSNDWTMRQFEVTDKREDRLWHTVYSDTKRLSIGFRIIRNLK